MKVREISGLSLLALGLILLINLFLPIQLPLTGVVLALLLVWAGICLMNGQFFRLHDTPGENAPHPDCEPLVRQCILRQDLVNLTDTDAQPAYVQVRALLGRITVRLPVDAEVTIVKQGALCLIHTPDGRATFLGEDQIVCGSRSENAPRLFIEAQALLGHITFTLG